jgi:hypothetical protein
MQAQKFNRSKTPNKRCSEHNLPLILPSSSITQRHQITEAQNIVYHQSSHPPGYSSPTATISAGGCCIFVSALGCCIFVFPSIAVSVLVPIFLQIAARAWPTTCKLSLPLPQAWAHLFLMCEAAEFHQTLTYVVVEFHLLLTYVVAEFHAHHTVFPMNLIQVIGFSKETQDSNLYFID